MIVFSGFLSLYFIFKLKINLKNQEESPIQEIEIKKTFPKNIPLIQKINKSNSLINSVLIKSMPIKLKNGSMTFNLVGDLAHEKEKKFRFIVTSKITGREMDLGSNNDVFWFWSKRISPPALYFAKHEDLYKTNLKTPLNPSWMIESLNVEVIDQSKIKGFSENDEYISIFEKRISATGEECTLVTTIDKKTEEFLSRKLIDNNNKIIINTTYKENIIKIEWKDENVMMEWNVKGRQLNVSLPESMWIIPDYKKKINMAIE